jgi:hypothetical protein
MRMRIPVSTISASDKYQGRPLKQNKKLDEQPVPGPQRIAYSVSFNAKPMLFFENFFLPTRPEVPNRAFLI